LPQLDDCYFGVPVKLVMCMRTRDQAELVDAHVSFHLNAGVDFVIATDHRSADGTLELLEAYEREGYLRLIRETGEQVRGSEWRTRMARMAALEYDADWVIHSDGDEFWWPKGTSLKQVLEPIPARYGVVYGFLRLFPPRLGANSFFAERMTVHIHTDAAINDPTNPYRPHAKIAHRGHPDVVVDRGAHSLIGRSLPALLGCCPIEVFHFPIRSLEQLEWRSSLWWEQLKRFGRVGNVKARRLQEIGKLEDHFESRVVSDDKLERGLASGSIVMDTRLRDVLRSLRLEHPSSPRQFALPREREALDLPGRDGVRNVAYAVDVATFGEAQVVRLQVRLDELERRLASVRHGQLVPPRR
jgi:Glycosyl transferase family 2